MRKLTVVISVVAASVPVAMSAQAAEVYDKDSSELDLYGKANAKYYLPSNGANDGSATYTRLGSESKARVNDQLTGSGQWEYEFKSSRAESQDFSRDKTRLTLADLKFGDYDSIDYGRNYGVAYDIGAQADVLPEFGGDTWTQTDVFMTGRTTGVATYRNNDFFGLVDGPNSAAQCQGRSDRTDVTEANGDSPGLSTTYEYEGFGVGAAYAKSDRADDQVAYGRSKFNVSDRNVEVWAAGLKYDTNNIYLVTTYSGVQDMTAPGNNHAANKAQNLEAVAQYQSDFGLRSPVAYPQSKDKDFGVHGDRGLVKYVDIGATYYFNKDMSTFVNYKTNLIDDSKFTKTAGIGTDDIIAIGLTYQF